MAVWDSINAGSGHGWETNGRTNPWVWVITFGLTGLRSHFLRDYLFLWSVETHCVTIAGGNHKACVGKGNGRSAP